MTFAPKNDSSIASWNDIAGTRMASFTCLGEAGSGWLGGGAQSETRGGLPLCDAELNEVGRGRHAEITRRPQQCTTNNQHKKTNEKTWADWPPRTQSL